VLCEKPVSLSLAQGEEMIAACAAAGVTFQVGHHMRSWASSAKAKAIIDSGALGKLTTLRFRQTHDWTGLGEVRGAFGSKELSGGGRCSTTAATSSTSPGTSAGTWPIYMRA
jgi:predicted dehydrogenase